jgi:hypothetical protein
LIEIPIAVGDFGRVAHVQEYLRQRKVRKFPPGCDGYYSHSAGILGKARSLRDKGLNLGKVKFDFSKLSARTMIRIANDFLDDSRDSGEVFPMVGIAHNKTFSQDSERELAEFLQWASSRDDIQFSTYPQILSAIKPG